MAAKFIKDVVKSIKKSPYDWRISYKDDGSTGLENDIYSIDGLGNGNVKSICVLSIDGEVLHPITHPYGFRGRCALEKAVKWWLIQASSDDIRPQ